MPSSVLLPRGAWTDKGAYDATAHDLCGRFEANFKKFEPFVEDSVKAAGIRQAA